MFERVAIVNRGEPAMRLIHAVRDLRHPDGTGPRTIALHTDAEQAAMFVREADEAVRIGPGPGEPAPTVNPYLDHDELARALRVARADAAWVGWGFVAEDPEFADLCERLGVRFVGPSGAVMRQLGDKVGAKLLAEQAGVPVAPWSGGAVTDPTEALTHARSIGYPLMIKASAGGGGRGIRRVEREAELAGAFERASAEAAKAFGDATLFMEQVVTDARHVEVQIIADAHGAVWAAGVRDCSLQRRNQKVIEESSSTVLPPAREQELKEAARALARAVGYEGAGTVEFLYQPAEDRFAFLEVNTRLQVEHPVTELTTGLDLVRLQLAVADGAALEGEPPSPRGHAIEARLNAEDPERGFAPAPGRIELLELPAGPGIRVDTGVAEGDLIPSEYDSMVAKVMAWGRDRDEAAGRLRRALSETTVLIDGGTTNRAFLLDLLRHPQVIAGDYDTGWLDRLTGDGGYQFVTRGDLALVAAAIEAYDAESALDRDRFYASAARGRPQVHPDVPRSVDLRFAGVAYRLEVACLGPGTYRVSVDGLTLAATVERLGRFEHRLTVGDERHRVRSITQGAGRLIEVDGVPHRVSQDDAGLVRAPGPSVVVSLAVQPGDVVEAGSTVAILESMKMETALAAPFTGTVIEVLASSNVQLDAGGPVVRLEPLEGEETAPSGAAVDFGRWRHREDAAGGEADTPREAAAAAVETLRRLVLGYDVATESVPDLLATLDAGSGTGDGLLAAELEVLRTFADTTALSRNRRFGDADDRAEAHSAREYLHAYLRSLDAEAEGLPASFQAKLRQALAHYGVTTLERTPDLDEALFRIHLAQQRATALLPAILGLLDRRLRDPRPPAGALGEALRDTLDRLILATQVRHPLAGDLARRARYRCFDQPRLQARRDAIHSRVRAQLLELAHGRQSPAERAEVFRELVDTQESLLGLLEDPLVNQGGLAPLLELLTRRYYRTRELASVRSVELPDRQAIVADFIDPRGQGRVIALSATAEDLSEALRTASTLTADLPADAGAGAVADVYVTWRDAPADLDLLSAGLEADLDAAELPPQLRRVTLSVTVAPGDAPGAPERPSVEHLTFRRTSDGFQERRHLRGIHPLVAGRLDLWRFEHFELTRLPTSAEHVYLFHGVAREHPDDERLFILAEVRDLTADRDADGHVVALPELEQVLAACLDDLRQARASRPADERPDWNRVILNVWPVVDLPIADLEPVVRALAPTTEGLGLEQVTVNARVAVPGAAPRDVVLRMARPPGQGFTMRLTEPSRTALQPFDETTRRVMKARRRGSVYPYELVPLISRDAGPSGDDPLAGFVEYDLDPDGDLQATSRPPGQNTAGVIVGVVTTHTERYPEGMRRVAVLGDPTRGLGSIAEPESRRIIAALDLAEELRAPVEWFAVSSGARIAMDSGTENMDWVAAVLRRIIEFTQSGGEINVVVAGINVGAQPYWNAEATMLQHTKGILVMTPDSAMVLTGKQALDYSGGVSAEDNFGIGGYDRVMGPNGQAQYWAPDLAAAVEVLFAHYDHSYVHPGERFPRPAPTSDPSDRDVSDHPHTIEGLDFTCVGEIFAEATNPGRKKPFDIRTVMRAAVDADHEPLERWPDMADAEMAVVWDAHLGGQPVTVLGIESRPLDRHGRLPADGPERWTAGTLFPRASKKVARAINAASGVRPVVVLANLSGFDGSPESLRELQLEYGAEIGRAVVNFDGPIVFCVISRYHGGAFVVFSKALNAQLEVAALEGSHASVIGGPPAAAVVFAGEVNARTDTDERIADLRRRIAAADEIDAARLRTEAEALRSQVRAEKLGEVAHEFDAVHSIQRALEVGSVDRLVAPAQLRPYLIDAVARGMQRTLDGP